MSADFSVFAKIYICGTDDAGVTFGRGLSAMLHAIEETGSLNKACKHIGVSYSKAWKRLNKIEAQTGIRLLERNSTRGTSLTPEGFEVMRFYDELNEKTNAFVVEEFERMSRTSTVFS